MKCNKQTNKVSIGIAFLFQQIKINIDTKVEIVKLKTFDINLTRNFERKLHQKMKVIFN